MLGLFESIPMRLQRVALCRKKRLNLAVFQPIEPKSLTGKTYPVYLICVLVFVCFGG